MKKRVEHGISLPWSHGNVGSLGGKSKHGKLRARNQDHQDYTVLGPHPETMGTISISNPASIKYAPDSTPSSLSGFSKPPPNNPKVLIKAVLDVRYGLHSPKIALAVGCGSRYSPAPLHQIRLILARGGVMDYFKMRLVSKTSNHDAARGLCPMNPNKTDRSMAPMGLRMALIVFVGLLLCIPSVGCQSALVTAYYLINGTDEQADFSGLKEKKIVVVCKSTGSLHYSNTNVPKDLSLQVSKAIQANVKKVKMVDQQKLSDWTDKHEWENYTDVGKAMKADMVVGIDLEGFNLFQGQTVYQGTANVVVHVYDCKAGGKEVFSRTIPPVVYPPNAGIPTSERQEGEFRRQFIGILAERVARHFYPHDQFGDIAQDVDALR
jgi:hypothetical protein